MGFSFKFHEANHRIPDNKLIYLIDNVKKLTSGRGQLRFALPAGIALII